MFCEGVDRARFAYGIYLLNKVRPACYYARNVLKAACNTHLMMKKKKKHFASFGLPTSLMTCGNQGKNVYEVCMDDVYGAVLV